MNWELILSHLLCINLGFLGGWFVLKKLVLDEIQRKKGGQKPDTLQALHNLSNTVYYNFPG